MYKGRRNSSTKIEKKAFFVSMRGPEIPKLNANSLVFGTKIPISNMSIGGGGGGF